MTMTDVFGREACDLGEFRALVEVEGERPPHARHVRQRVPVYDAASLAGLVGDRTSRRVIRDELAGVLGTGAGIFVLAGAFEHAVVDRATAVFEAMIAQQHEEGRAVGDHYAKPGANDRVWNAIEKLALRDPDVFVDYYANDMVALAAESWLGPGYQISSQINVVNPGGEAQQPHRDFHLGFMTDDEAADFPAHAHRLSPMLTLQGAVAHCDMPVESGPTMYLPYSQRYELGYLAWRRPDFVAYFDEHRTQLPVHKGDVVVFNPALFHAAGSNVTSDVKRMANLLQISSPMGRAMETMDRITMSRTVYPVLRQRRRGMSERAVANVVVAAADGYAFPTNLDNDPPLDGLTPPSHAAIMTDALERDLEPAEFDGLVAALVERRRSA
ncbi:MAG: phytanoyl-CoA dioxygenase family protein [Ilumatobacter sp.]|uniref:phytanoyl-CoA dioxygenase family protein n=1 Tax=Ilumatobacter sp. TaxID=1967498 RepID=UPI0026376E87|nr:phytanoyl-CoA dioxygenase family protein [Ilumatobacter sp.]MDJ0770202.1 phytanoyl-CoA dioxygenase family protein [Ilumatobacter sp.]